MTSPSRWALSLASGILLVYPVLPQAWNLISLLLLSGLFGILFFRKHTKKMNSTRLIALSAMTAFPREAVRSFSHGLLVLLPLAFVFLKASLIMFGGGVVAIPLFHQELVQTYHWLNTAAIPGRCGYWTTDPWPLLRWWRPLPGMPSREPLGLS